MSSHVESAQETLPHDLEAERVLLGRLLLTPALLDEVELPTEHLYWERHQLLLAAMRELRDADKPVDFVSVGHQLGDQRDPAGGPAYMASLVDGVPKGGRKQVVYLVQRIEQTARARRLLELGSETVTRVIAGEDADTVKAQVQARIDEIDSRAQGGFAPLTGEAESFLDRIEQASEAGLRVTGVPSGIADLDEITSGFQRSQLTVVAGRPGMGKTSLAMQMGAHAALRAGATVGVVSLEMSRQELFARIVASEGSVDLKRLLRGDLRADEWSRATDAIGKLRDCDRLHIDDSPGVTMEQIRARARALVARHGLDLLIVDYLQIAQLDARHRSRYDLVTSLSSSFLRLARELAIPLVLVSQMSRANAQRIDKRPQLSDLRESGAIEQDAHLVLMLHRDDYYKADDPETEGLAELSVAKHRNGPTGQVDLVFLKEYVRFEPLERHHEEAA